MTVLLETQQSTLPHVMCIKTNKNRLSFKLFWYIWYHYLLVKVVVSLSPATGKHFALCNSFPLRAPQSSNKPMQIILTMTCTESIPCWRKRFDGKKYCCCLQLYILLALSRIHMRWLIHANSLCKICTRALKYICDTLTCRLDKTIPIFFILRWLFIIVVNRSMNSDIFMFLGKRGIF